MYKVAVKSCQQKGFIGKKCIIIIIKAKRHSVRKHATSFGTLVLSLRLRQYQYIKANSIHTLPYQAVGKGCKKTNQCYYRQEN